MAEEANMGVLLKMAFTEAQAGAALDATSNNLEAALQWLLDYNDGVPNTELKKIARAAPAKARRRLQEFEEQRKAEAAEEARLARIEHERSRAGRHGPGRMPGRAACDTTVLVRVDLPEPDPAL